MQIELIIPGMLWPAVHTEAPCRGLRLDTLETLLAVGRHRLGPGRPPESLLLERFGLAPDTALAGLRRLGEDSPPPDDPGRWLCADPVGLRFAREHLLLVGAAELAISAAEAGELVAGLNREFRDIGQFEVATPERWYLRPARPATAHFAPLAQVLGRPVAMFMPEGGDAAQWHRWINEIQVWLHNHPLNRAREEAGEPLVNSLWPWGGGAPAVPAAAPAPTVCADDPLVRGLARAAGARIAADPFAPAEDRLVYLERVHHCALRMDLDGWRAALEELERTLFVPLLEALRKGRIQRLALRSPGERASLELDLARPALWPFWRRPVRLQELIANTP